VSERAGPKIVWFADLRIADRSSVGGKGANLGELTRAGIAVPPGFVVTAAAFEAFLAAFDPDQRVRRRVASLCGADPVAIEATCRAIRADIEKASLPEALAAEIAASYNALGGADAARPVAVRSSGTSEDHDDASFAGLQDTYLWIKGADAVADAVKRCWASLYSVESVTYRRHRAMAEDDVAMAVVVQDMVEARCAGVMFTRGPLTGDKSVITIEAAWGLGSALVGGLVTPDTFVVNKITGEITRRAISRKLARHVPDFAKGCVIETEVPPDQQAIACVSDAEIAALAGIAKTIERHYGQAQDIEWAIDQHAGAGAPAIMLLQARPETVWNKRDREKKPVADAKASPLSHVLRALTKRE